MIFKIVPDEESGGKTIFKKRETEALLLSAIMTLSSGKITDNLFVQKDVRGFSSESFYIFKPNDKRLWHKAVAYVDAEEFADAILNAGRNA